MPAEVRIHIEGDAKLLPGFRRFFDSLYQAGIQVKLSTGGANAVEDFVSGVRKFPDAVNILLIDADGPHSTATVQEVRRRINRYAPGVQIADDRLHFMVQVMESWFLADRTTLQAYYGPGFAENRLPANRQVEQILKDDVINGLIAATRDTGKGRYHKTRHAPALLALLNPAQVRAAAPACAKLFTALEQL